MTVSARAVAAEIRSRIPGVGRLKVQKLLYYAQGHHLATFGEPLFSETISAWDMGPVVARVWHAERHDEVEPDGRPDIGEAQLNTIGYVVGRYGGMSGPDLRRLTHGEPPWQEANAGRRPGGAVAITNDRIRAYFSHLHGEIEDEEPTTSIDDDQLSAMLRGADERRRAPARADDLAELRRRRADLSG